MADHQPQPLGTSAPPAGAAAEDVEAGRPHGPGAPGRRQGCCACCTYLRFVKIMKAIGILSCIGVGCLNLLSFSEAVNPSAETLTDDQGNTYEVVATVWSVAGITNIVFLFFQLALSLLMFLGFFELGFVLTYFPVLEGWVGLGVMLIYLSISALTELNCTTKYHNNPAAMAVCFILAAEGLFFTLAGCCGGKKITARAQKLEDERAADGQ